MSEDNQADSWRKLSEVLESLFEKLANGGSLGRDLSKEDEPCQKDG